MKTSTVKSKLSHFKTIQDSNGHIWFYSRSTDRKVQRRYVKVINQEDGNCVALPIFQHRDGEETVVFHAKTIKSLVQFLEGV